MKEAGLPSLTALGLFQEASSKVQWSKTTFKIELNLGEVEEKKLLIIIIQNFSNIKLKELFHNS